MASFGQHMAEGIGVRNPMRRPLTGVRAREDCEFDAVIVVDPLDTLSFACSHYGDFEEVTLTPYLAAEGSRSRS